MKRTIHIGFAIVFMVLSVGVIVNKHYSGGELFSVALFGEPESCCEMPCDCCDNETELYQLTGDYIFSYCLFEVADLEVLSFILNNEEFTSSAEILCEYCSVEYRKYIHPPRKVNHFLSEIQSYLL